MATETRTHWKEAEWQMVCAELYKAKPIECRSTTLVGIVADDMKVAMHKALPKARWRLSMPMTKIRPKLLEQMGLYIQVHDAMERQREESERQAQETQSMKDIERSALAPFASLLAELMFEHLRPMIDNYLSGQSGNQPVDAVVTHHRTSTHHTQTATRKVKVGVIGLLPIQEESLKAQFPQLDFKFVESGQNSEQVRGLMNSDAIFGLTQKMAHNAEYVLRKSPAWTKYRRVGGKGTTAVKRAISMWMNQPVA